MRSRQIIPTCTMNWYLSMAEEKDLDFSVLQGIWANAPKRTLLDSIIESWGNDVEDVNIQDLPFVSSNAVDSENSLHM